jgi:hypothetical protein
LIFLTFPEGQRTLPISGPRRIAEKGKITNTKK